MRSALTFSVLALLGGTAPISAVAAVPFAAAPQSPRALIDSFVVDASQRFGVPEAWIRAVMAVESRGLLQATSPKGAMGLMQLMPATWADLRARLGLGSDPYDPHDNILAGAAYLRELYDQFGAEGFLSAYNAGPGRYIDHVTTGRPLPAETRAYVAKLAPIIAVAGAQQNVSTVPRPTLFAPIGRIVTAAVRAPDGQSGRGGESGEAPDPRMFIAVTEQEHAP